jgi:hypothetical protein
VVLLTGARPVTVVLIRDKSKTGFDLALVTTEKDPDPARAGMRYAARRAIEVAIEDSRQLFGTGQARNRTAAAVERTLPFMLACQAVAVCWYATAGHHPADAEARRLEAPWYTGKTEPSSADMTAKLRRVIIAAKLKQLGSHRPEPSEIDAIRLAWEDALDLAALTTKVESPPSAVISVGTSPEPAHIPIPALRQFRGSSRE